MVFIQMLALIQKEPNILADINILVTVEGHTLEVATGKTFFFWYSKICSQR